MYCSHCKTTEGSFIKTSRGIGGKQYYACRPCNTARLKEYRKTKAGAEKARIATHKSIQKYKDKQDARNILNSAIRRGEVVRPLNCSVCNTEAKCHGHHDDYTKPYKVKWVCRGCHSNIHRVS